MNTHPRRSDKALPHRRLQLELSEQAYLQLVCQGILQGCSPTRLAEQLLSQSSQPDRRLD